MNDADEPLLQDLPLSRRMTIFPVSDAELYAHAEKLLASFWVPGEIDLAKDREGLEKLPENTQFFIKMILGFFAGADGLVNDCVGSLFDQVTDPCAKLFYSYQGANESVHSVTYSLLLDSIVGDEEERARLFAGLDEVECIKRKAAWMTKWTAPSQPFATRVLALCCVELLHFAGSFAAVFYLVTKGNPLPGLAQANSLIARDESLHGTFACLLWDRIRHKPSREHVLEIIRSAVDVEVYFMTEALPCALLGMSSDQMVEYIKLQADNLLVRMGFQKEYDAVQPWPWVDMLSTGAGGTKSNFFEDRPTAYALAHAGRNGKGGYTFSTEEEF